MHFVQHVNNLRVNKKSEIQFTASQLWKESEWGAVYLHTGLGKTKLGVDIMRSLFKDNPDSKVLIIVPSTNLRDKEWVNEIVKWGCGNYFMNITIECIHTIYKKEHSVEWDLVIIDEVHETLGEKFREVHKFKSKRALALSATPPKQDKEKMEFLESLYPTLYEYNLEEGIEKGTASSVIIYNLAVPFTKSEKHRYALIDSRFKALYSVVRTHYETLKKLGMFIEDDIFKMMRRIKSDKEHILYESVIELTKVIHTRKHLCYNAFYKKGIIIKILNKFPEMKWIVFGNSIKTIESLKEEFPEAMIYHSKMKGKARKEALKQAEEAKLILSVDALSRGFNIPSLEGGISTKAVSSEWRFFQELGRINRISDSIKKLKFINLYVADTQEEVWVKEKTKNFFPIFINSLNEIKK